MEERSVQPEFPGTSLQGPTPLGSLSPDVPHPGPLGSECPFVGVIWPFPSNANDQLV